MVRYDPYTDKFIDDGVGEPISATIDIDKSSKGFTQVNVVEVSDASIEKIADAVARKLSERSE